VEYTNTALNTSDNLSSYLPDSHHSLDVVYGGEKDEIVTLQCRLVLLFIAITVEQIARMKVA